MFFVRVLVVALICQWLPISARADSTVVDDCMHTAITAARQHGLGTVLFSYLDVQTLAARAAWWRWQMRWNTLSITTQQEVIATVNRIYEKIGSTALHAVDLNSIHWETTNTQHDYAVTGSYYTSTGEHNRTNWFDLTVVVTNTTQCHIIRFNWNNVSLDRYVASQLPEHPH